MSNDDKQQKRLSIIRAVTFVIVLLMTFFLAEISFAFYYKYSNAVSKDSYTIRKKTDYMVHQYVNYLEDVSRYDIDSFQNYINNNAVGDVVLLKDNGKNGFDIVASSDQKNRIGTDFEDKECGNIYNHDFQKDYFTAKILPENSALVCMFTASGEYIVGFKATINQKISGTDDEYFSQWAVKNLLLTFILSFAGALAGLFTCILFVLRYLNLKHDYLHVKEASRKKIQELGDKLYIDPMTGLLNKAALLRDIQNFKSPKVVLIDIDDFGKMNDFYGKLVCDKILVQMAQLLSEFAKSENMIAYCVEADQFALVEDGEFFIDRYEDLADELLSKFKGRMISVTDENGAVVDDIEIHSTIGFALDKEQTLRKAAIALKSAKTLNKDYVCYFKGLNQKEEYEDQIERSKLIQNATINGNIVPYYQPIFDRDGNIAKYECLIRILDRGEVVSPHVFLGISKRIKRYAELEKLLIKKSFEQLSQNENLVLSINLSGRDMTDGDVSALVINLLNKHKVADRVVFEIVEDEDVENVERVSMFIDKVKNMGAKIAIDDFGSGYSNFSYILKLKPDYVKIDGSIIKDIDINKDSYAIARAIVAFARDLGIKTIAEYVHSKEILNICKEIGVDEFQGFYLGAPGEKVF
ncbi:EAL domain-containing protein [Campylobacter curvus]|uniref:EAL domain-containing protein n=1 Tax=Campylobacter curvus TaxID=200 RepID=UPI00147077CF|nr:GGDEF domain-containing phosphodiesterase [Campylobacter curvus]